MISINSVKVTLLTIAEKDNLIKKIVNTVIIILFL